MPRSAGTYSLPPSYKAVSGQTVRTEQHNPPLEDIAKALTESMPRDGSASFTGPLSMNGNRVTNLAPGSAAGDAVRLDQVTLYSAWLESVSGLALEANNYIYATGAGTAAKATITPYMRTVLDDANAAAARITLGVIDPVLATKAQAEAGSNNTAYMTPLRTSDAMATQPLAREFESTGNGIPAADSPVTKSHGLGAKPSLHTVSIVCATADLGYSVGDEITLASHEGNGLRGLTTWRSAADIGFVWSSGIFVINRTGIGVAAITNARWTVTYRAWR